ncbi:MAG: C4-dicarboxylate ABC transporter [Acidobacteria bacterium]|nr:C4-dicarboxylate ABC transporter [Acidobacteriota bacterium]
MNAAIASLLALLLAIILSMTTRINVGILAITLAWIVGVYFAGMKPDAIIAGFPGSLFLTLAGVTMLFACAESNGTLERLAHKAVLLVKGRGGLLPLLFFLIAMVISSVGPGAISSVALVVPLAMAIGHRSGIPSFLTALMVANGANAGNLSPISSIGVIANSRMAEAGITGHELKVWASNFGAHAAVSLVAWFFLTRSKTEAGTNSVALSDDQTDKSPLTRSQMITIAVILIWICGVLFAKLNLGLSAFAAVVVMIIGNLAEEREIVKKAPWTVILMVCGVSVLISLLEKTGGMDLFTGLLARMAGPSSINGVIAFITGAISTYSSTSGVVLPAFLPTASKLAAQLGGGDPLAIALSINVGSALVDVSPLSTLGALCVATVTDETESKKLFQKLFVWGLSMTVVGAILCQLFAGWVARI